MKNFISILALAGLITSIGACGLIPFSESNLSGRYKIQKDEQEQQDNKKGGFMKDLLGKVLKSSSIEITFDGNSKGVIHLGNSVIGLGAKLFNVDLDNKNLKVNNFDYKIEGHDILIKYNNEDAFTPWAKIDSYSNDYNYIKVIPLQNNPEQESMQLMKVSDEINIPNQ